MTASPPERRLQGILLRSASATAFAGMAALLKAASDRGVATPEMIFYRNGWALLVVSAWIGAGPGWSAVRTAKPLAHITRSTIGLVSMLLTFGALALLPLGEATTLTYAAPLIATILSGLVLGEAIGPRRWAAVAVGFVGVALVAQPGGSAVPLLGVAVAIAAAFGQSAVMITVRQISRTEGTAAIVFWFSTFTALAGAAMLPVFGRWHDPLTMAMLAGAGLLGGFAQIAMTGSLRFAPVSVVVPFDYLQIILATAIGWAVFGSAPTPLMLAGAALIAGSGLYTAYRERVRGREPVEARSMPEG
ncbi:DMT family transporter [uncultured Sphingomonas sp.]|uniref:DMT family transporter n=1 Tax=uncultured Sphingomonas sp. TaxID=158754 RepID=UPI0025F660CD|nr:DMT family transporter [uncultured Sphingomonas sp.]